MRPTRDFALLQTASVWAERGTCSRAKVGCVISRDGRILVQGYNGAPAGLPNCDHDCHCGFSEPVYQPPEAHNLECSFRNTGCTIAVHAEANSIAFAGRVGVRLDGSQMHSTRVPCTNCAMLVINAGITRVAYIEDHRDMGGLDLLHRAFVKVTKVDMITL